MLVVINFIFENILWVNIVYLERLSNTKQMHVYVFPNAAPKRGKK